MAALGTATDTVTTVSAVVVPDNAGRRRLTLTNDGSAKIYLSFTPEGATVVPAVVGSGTPLSPGGSVTEDRSGPGTHRLFAGAISAIVGAGTVVVAITELDER